MTERASKNYEEYYETIKFIDNGAFGTVYKGKEKGKDELRAIKGISLQKIKENLINQYGGEDLKEHFDLCVKGFISEFEIMKLCSNCDYSVRCYEYFNNEDNFVIIMELCDDNLSKLLTKRMKNSGKGLNSEEILEIMKQLNKAFKAMKENNIIHRDLKLENILIKYLDEENKKFIVKLSDYRCSKRLSSLSKNYLNTINGTLSYMAPEILKEEEHKKYNYKCDLWSIGVIIYTLYFGIFPYNGETEFEIMNKIENLGKRILKKTDNEDLDDLIINLLEKDPSKRFTWEQYFNHSFFKDKNRNKIVEAIMERIKCTAFFGFVCPDETRRFDDSDYLTKEKLFQYKLSEIKFFLGQKNGKESILGLQTTYTKKTGEKIVNEEARDKAEKELDIKIFEIPSNDYICNLFLKTGDERITQIKLVTKKGKEFVVGCDEGEERILDYINDNKEHIILAFFGGYRKVLEALSAIYIPIEDYLVNSRGYFELKIKMKKKDFKDNINLNKLKHSDQVLFRVCNLPDKFFNKIIKYCLF